MTTTTTPKLGLVLDGGTGDKNEPTLTQYATLLFLEPPNLLYRRHKSQTLIVALKGDPYRLGDFVVDAKHAWAQHADGVHLPALTDLTALTEVVSTVATNIHPTMHIILDMPSTITKLEEYVRILDTIQVRGVTLHDLNMVERVRHIVDTYHLSITLYAVVKADAAACHVAALRRAGAEHVLFTATPRAGGSLTQSNTLHDTYTRTFGAGRDKLRHLLEDAVQVVQRTTEDAPFVTKSGLETTVYMDMRRLVSYPKYLTDVAKAMLGLVDVTTFEYVAGVPSGAVPLATVMSQLCGKPLLMLREKPKTYGMRKHIEGVFQYHRRCLLVEDVTTTGMSILAFVHILRRAGLLVHEALVVVAREPAKPTALLAKAQCSLTSLFQCDNNMKLQ